MRGNRKATAGIRQNPLKFPIAARTPHEGALRAAHFACPLAHAAGRLKGSSLFDGSLRPDEPPFPILSLVDG
jgi:hypothetical protein